MGSPAPYLTTVSGRGGSFVLGAPLLDECPAIIVGAIISRSQGLGLEMMSVSMFLVF